MSLDLNIGAESRNRVYDPQVLGYIVISLRFTQPQHGLLVQTTLAFKKGCEQLQLS